MKLKLFSIGLLATIVIPNQSQAMMKRTYEAPKMEEKLKEQEEVQKKIEPRLDIGSHAGDHEAAVNEVVDRVGKHPTNSTGKTINHRVDDVNTRLGTKSAAPTGPSTHHKVTDLMAIQGEVTNGAANQGVNSGHGGANADDLAETAIKKEEAILARLKAGIRANKNVAIVARVSTKTTNTPAGATVRADRDAAARANNIQDFLAEIGW